MINRWYDKDLYQILIPESRVNNLHFLSSTYDMEGQCHATFMACASDFSGSGSPVSNVWTLNRQHAQQSESRTAALQTYKLQSCTTDLMVFVTAVSGFISAKLVS